MNCKYEKWDLVSKNDYYKIQSDLVDLKIKIDQNKNEIIYKMDRDKSEITFEGLLKWGMIYVIFLSSLANCSRNQDNSNTDKLPASEVFKPHATP